MREQKTILITGTRKGIGRFLVEYYIQQGCTVFGCSRGETDYAHARYRHFRLDVADEKQVKQLFAAIRKNATRLDVLINNAGIASMNHILTTPLETVRRVLDTNVVGTILFCREAAKLMMKSSCGRIVNFATVATPLKLPGEAVYACSKAAVVNLTEILAHELGPLGITVNAVGPTPTRTDLIRSVPQEKMDRLLERQAIRRFGEFKDIANVIDFFIKPESNFVTGQVLYLGGV